jgi:hypothetical protein
MLLAGGDVAGQWQACTRVQVRDGEESVPLDVRLKIELAHNPAFVPVQVA